jgi:hypothetical protein
METLMIPPRLAEACTDRRLIPTTVRVYALLHVELTYWGHRPVKLSSVQRMTGLSKGAASKALAALVRFGYLESGPVAAEHAHLGGVRAYRLVPPALPGFPAETRRAA